MRDSVFIRRITELVMREGQRIRAEMSWTSAKGTGSIEAAGLFHSYNIFSIYIICCLIFTFDDLCPLWKRYTYQDEK